MRFKNNEFKLWLEKTQNITLEEFWEWPQEKRSPVLQEYMDDKEDVKTWQFTTEELVEFLNDFN